MKKTVLGVRPGASVFVITACIAGIIAGSFKDFQINEALANKTEAGAFFATYGTYFSYCLYPAAGMCLYKGLKKKGSSYNLLANVLLVIAYFAAVYYSNSYNGAKVRELLGYSAGSSSAWLSVCSWLFWVVLYAWVPFVLNIFLDDRNPEKLIAVGAAVLIAGLLSDCVNLWLKQVASRPRYKYLITLDDPVSEFRNWWQMVPNLAGNNDNYKSWPSGNMTIAAMMFNLPMLTDVINKRSNRKNWTAFGAACVFVALYGYNRIHMTNHFLSDVCFGTLTTYLIHAVVSHAFLSTVEE